MRSTLKLKLQELEHRLGGSVDKHINVYIISADGFIQLDDGTRLSVAEFDELHPGAIHVRVTTESYRDYQSESR